LAQLLPSLLFADWKRRWFAKMSCVRVHPRFLFLLAAFVSLGVEVQSPAQGQSQRAETVPQGRVTGHVILSDTRGPARNAAILLISSDGHNRDFQRVGLDGTYLFEHVVPDEYILIPYLDGYLSILDNLPRGPVDTTLGGLFARIVAAQGSVKVGTDGTQKFDISLGRGATVSGRVVYSDGSPAIQVAIELENTADPPPRAGSFQLQMGDISRLEFVHHEPETDDQGRFRISGIPAGNYRVAAVQLQKTPISPDETMVRSILGAVRFYTNSTVHPALARTYSLAAGQELTGLEIQIPLEGFYSVQGKVVAHDGRPITNAEVTVVNIADPSLYFMAVVSDGYFRLDRLPPGTYTVAARFGNMISGGEVSAAFGAGSTSFTLTDRNLNDVILTLPEAPLP
jgi:hypothetical protein